MVKISKEYREFLERTKEYFFALQTNIQLSGEDLKVLAVSSSFKNQGKSTISIGLANALAMSDYRVLLLDLDLRNSVYRGIFNASEKLMGVTEYLTGSIKVSDILTVTNDDMPFYVIEAGKVSPNPITLLKSKKFVNMMVGLRKSFDYIIVDTPPIGQVIDAAIITQHCDASFLVTELGTVTRTQLAQAKRQLEQTDTPFLGVVVNKTALVDTHYGYYGEYKN